MATIQRNHPEEGVDTRESLNCSFCGHPPVAARWTVQESKGSICRNCALLVLPEIMAEAVVAEHGHEPRKLYELQGDLETAMKNFLRQAAANAISRGPMIRRKKSAREEGGATQRRRVKNTGRGAATPNRRSRNRVDGL